MIKTAFQISPARQGRTPFFVIITLITFSTLSFSRSQPLPSYGFVGDGVTMNTRAFNSVIDSISKRGGGALSIPPGRYLTGTIYLKSGVTLNLESGAEILGSTNLADYPKNPPPAPTTTLEFGQYSLIYAAGQHDIAITGEGKIYGQGSDSNFTKTFLIAHGWSATDAYLKRPYGLCFVGCRHVQVRNVTLENMAFWTEDYLDCDDVLVDGISVNNLKEDYNNDGIDLDGSRDVRISNCNFVAGDDAICLKSSYSMCENVAISNCVARSLCNGIKFGTASRVGFKNISISNCVIYETGLAGLALEIVDGGIMDGVTISNLTMDDVGTPIFIRLGNRAKKFLEDQPDIGIGTLKNIIISDITATVFEKNGTFACPISGLPDHPIENVRISNVNIALKNGYSNEHLDEFQHHNLNTTSQIIGKDLDNKIKSLTAQQVPENPADYPEYSMFGPLPAYGFFCRHVKNIFFNNVDLSFEKPEYRTAFICYDVHELNIDGLHAQSSMESNPLLLFRDVTDAFLSRCTAPDETPVFLRLEGNSDHILIFASDLSHAVSAISLEAGIQKDGVKIGKDVILPTKTIPNQK
jgi:Glycosyl hydrolases family 28